MEFTGVGGVDVDNSGLADVYGRTVLRVKPLWYSRKLDLQCIHMGVSLNGGTPKTPENYHF